MAIIFEDSAKVTKKKIQIPSKAKKTFKALKDVYKPFLDRNVRGSKVLKSLGSDKKYNKKGNESKLNGNEIEQDSVSVEDAKVRLHRMNKMNKNSLEYALYGGELAKNIYSDGISRARGVKEVDAVKPPKPTSNASLKPYSYKSETISTPNGKIKYTVTSENRVIKEGFEDDDNPYYDYLCDYNESYVFNEFIDNPKGKQSWGVLINPSMYATALKEFTKFGKLVRFPAKYVYQWIGIIMKNTAILRSNSNIAGHSSWFPEDEFEDFLTSYLKDRFTKYNHPSATIEVYPSELQKLCDEEFSSLKDSVNEYSQMSDWLSEDYSELIDEFNEKPSYYGKIEINYNERKLYWVIDDYNFLDLIGFYDWMQMPDGSDAFSDFGIEPLERILSEYSENLEPEKVLVIVNKALDVYHCRGDMASIFITGGSKALSQIAEHKIKSSKKVYITEKQLIKNGKYIRKHA